ncbi:DUF927 domain-containing protein, partial [Kitasatospora sp. NPDC058402]
MAHGESNETATTTDRVMFGPGPAIEVSRGEWSYSIGAGEYPRGVYMLSGRGDTQHWRPMGILPFVTEVVVKRNGNGQRRTLMYRLKLDPASKVSALCTRADLKNGQWAIMLDVPVSMDDAVLKAIGTAVLAVAEDAPRTEGAPTWTDSGLQMPPADVGPAGYGIVSPCTEEEAREVWDKINEILSRPESRKAALYVGAALAGSYVRPFRRQATIWHANGSSSGSKSTILRTAASLYGPQERVTTKWNMAPVALTASLVKLGTLPAFRDEIGMQGRKTAREYEAMIFSITEGAERVTTDRETGDTRSTGEWYATLMSTGNDSLLGMATENGGLNVRVVELESPLLADKKTAVRLATLSNLAYGWPFRWLTEQITLERAWREIALAERDLGAAQEEGAAGRIAEAVALAVAGAALLESLIGTEGLRANALRCGKEIVDQLVGEMSEAAMKQGDRLIRAIQQSIASDPALWPTKQEYTTATEGGGSIGLPVDKISSAFGVLYSEGGTERVAVLSEKLKVVANASGIVAPLSGLRELRADGRLVLESTNSARQGMTKREHLGKKVGQVACYVFVRPGNEPPAAEVVDPAEVVADLPLPSMPTLPDHLVQAEEERPRATEAAPVVPAAGTVRASVPEQAREAKATVPNPAGPYAKAGKKSRREVERAAQSLTVWSVSGGVASCMAKGLHAELSEKATGDLAALVASIRAHAPSGEITVLIGADMREGYGLPDARLDKGISAWTKAGAAPKGPAGKWARPFVSLVEAGWHQPFAPGQPPVVMATTNLEHSGHKGGNVRLTVVDWLREQEFPRGPEGDNAGALEMAYRVERFTELTGWAFTGTEAITAVRGLREELTAHSFNLPWWVSESLGPAKWVGTDYWNRPL